MGQVQQIREVLDDPFRIYPTLTPIERRVLRLASRGASNRTIAGKLAMTNPMVAYTMRSGMLKMNVKKSDLPDIVFSLISKIIG
jgi:DNA-binding NarL/FixJ family response regulator